MTTDPQVQQLRAWIQKQRETADLWDEQNKAGYWPVRPKGAARAPQPQSRGAIQNWINWLRSQANEVEAILDTTEDQP